MSATRSSVSSTPQESRTRPVRGVVAPLGAPVGGRVQAAERGRRGHQPGRAQELGHRLGRGERERHHARDPAHLLESDHIGRIACRGRASAPSRTAGCRHSASVTAAAFSVWRPEAAGPACPATGGPATRRSRRGWRRSSPATPAGSPAAPDRGWRRSRAAGLSGRSAPWFRSPPPGRRRGRAGSGRAAWPWCCRPRPARPASCAAPASTAMSHTSRPGLAGVSSSTSRTPSKDGYGPAVGASTTSMPRGTSASTAQARVL